MKWRCMKAWQRKDHGVEGMPDGSGGDETLDGTEDVHGRPASKRSTGGWKGAMFVIVEQVMVNLAFFGVSTNLIVYLTTIMHQSNSDASTNVTNWFGAGYVTPLLAAFFADSYGGRFMGTLISSAIYIAGLVILTISGALHSLRPPQCPSKDVSCPSASLTQASILFLGLYVVDVGAGGVQGTVVTLGADQFDEEDDKEKYQKSSYFNYVYQTVLIGSFISSIFFVYLQENVSVGLAWGISCGLVVVGTIIFLMGYRKFRYHRPGGNPVTRMAQVLVATVRKRGTAAVNPDDLYEAHNSEIEKGRRIQHTNMFRFLDRAAVLTNKDKERLPAQQNPWRVCSVSQVEEFKFLLRVLPVFVSTIFYTVSYSQLSTLFIVQGQTLDRNLGSFLIPAASLAIFECLSVFFWVAVYDKILVPFLRRRTGNQKGISELTRIGIGLALSILSLTLAALVEIKRLHVVRQHHLQNDTTGFVPMSIFWEVPQYFVMGASEVCTNVGLMEFFYAQAPDAIRSLGSSITLLNYASGYFLSTAVLKVVGRVTKRGGKPGWVADNLNQGRLDHYFWLLAIMSAVNLLLFMFCAWRYEYTVTKGPIVRELAGPQTQQKAGHTQPQPNQTRDLPEENNREATQNYDDRALSSPTAAA